MRRPGRPPQTAHRGSGVLPTALRSPGEQPPATGVPSAGADGPADPAAAADRVLEALQGTQVQLERTRRTLELFVQSISRVPAPERRVVPLPTRADVAREDRRAERAPEVVVPPTDDGQAVDGPAAGDRDGTPPALLGHVLRHRPEGPVVAVGSGVPGGEPSPPGTPVGTAGPLDDPAPAEAATLLSDLAPATRASAAAADRRPSGAWRTGSAPDTEGAPFTDALLGRRRTAAAEHPVRRPGSDWRPGAAPGARAA